MPAIVLKLIVIRKRGVVISSKDVNIIEFRGGGRETLPVGGRIADGPFGPTSSWQPPGQALGTTDAGWPIGDTSSNICTLFRSSSDISIPYSSSTH
jgi:hypothetical protein